MAGFQGRSSTSPPDGRPRRPDQSLDARPLAWQGTLRVRSSSFGTALPTHHDDASSLNANTYSVSRPRRRTSSQHSHIESHDRCGVLDFPPSRGMTVVVTQQYQTTFRRFILLLPILRRHPRRQQRREGDAVAGLRAGLELAGGGIAAGGFNDGSRQDVVPRGVDDAALAGAEIGGAAALRMASGD